MTEVRSAIACSLAGLAIACGDAPPFRFTDITERAAMHFRYTFGDSTYENILESSGSGVTVFDYDGDGDLDLYLLNGTYLEGISDPAGRVFANTPDELYRNNGNGTFIEVAREAGLDDRHWSMAASAFDYDGDGDVDVYLLNYGPNAFYRNNGDPPAITPLPCPKRTESAGADIPEPFSHALMTHPR